MGKPAVKKVVNKSSDLPADVQHFVRKIYSEATGNLKRNVDCKITKRGIETPLGVLSKAQIERGDGILDKILAEIKVCLFLGVVILLLLLFVSGKEQKERFDTAFF